MNKEKLKVIHAMLSELEVYVARKAVLAIWDSEDLDLIRDMQDLIERLVAEIKSNENKG